MSDNESGVVSVVFKIGATLIGEAAVAPYTVGWDTVSFADGGHTVIAIATDNAGNQAAATINVTVDNSTAPPPEPCTSIYGCFSGVPPPLPGGRVNRSVALSHRDVSANELKASSLGVSP